jgi:hypothetical protein
VLAIEAANDEAVRRAFPDGICWVELGQAPVLASLQVRLLERLAGESLRELARRRARPTG